MFIKGFCSVCMYIWCVHVYMLPPCRKVCEPSHFCLPWHIILNFKLELLVKTFVLTQVIWCLEIINFSKNIMYMHSQKVKVLDLSWLSKRIKEITLWRKELSDQDGDPVSPVWCWPTVSTAVFHAPVTHSSTTTHSGNLKQKNPSFLQD